MSGASPADRQKMRELLEERKRKLEELKQKNSASPGGAVGSGSLVNTPDKSSAAPNAAAAAAPSTSRALPSIVMSPGGAGMSSPGVLGMVNAMLTNAAVSVSNPASTSSTPAPIPSMHSHMSRVYRSELSMCVGVASVDVQPKEVPMHSRPCQTDPSLLQSLIDASVLASRGSTASQQPQQSQQESSSDANQDQDDENDNDDTANDDASSTAISSVEAHEKELLRRHMMMQLPSHEKDPLLASPSFVGFLKRSSPVVEQAMTLQDRYTLRPAPLAADHSTHASADSSFRSVSNKAARRNPSLAQGDGLDLVVTLHDEQFTKDQDIYDVQFNPSDSSRVLTSSYSSSIGSSVIEWNLEYDGRAESRHHCPSRITSLRYWNGLEPQRTITPDSRGDANQRLIIGGSYTGQIVLWDMKASSFRPILTLSHSSISSSSAGASPHQHPIYNIIPIDSHLFATADTMGLMAIWDLNKLQQPVEVISLSWTAGSSAADSATTTPSAAQQEVAVTSLCFRDDNTFFVTSEDGALYQGQRHGDFRGLTKSLTKGHEATITSSDLHPSPSPSRVVGRSVAVSNNLSDLMLTASADWSVALWSPRNLSAPLHRFAYFNDYVLDVAWSPVHPAMFAAADGSGCLSVWNLNQDTEVPCVVNRSIPAAINRLSWNPHISTGNLMLAGAEHHGNIHIFELSHDIGTPKPDDWSKFDEVVTSFLSSNMTPSGESASVEN
eukprot:TRINITY_DN5627_c0_g1_i1.p2 TRINITY_DN5627_c0_g1~~TRINITY_DN5627_c0_g1_i1.p2  ORF type:complete len:723 (+),score=135.95 TRINITY_DN5627_c0_g1_i1:3228-5396(+)